MKYFFEMPDFPGSRFEIHVSMLTGKQKLFKNDIPVERSTEKGRPFLIPDDNGGFVQAFTKTSFPDMAPVLYINGAKHLVCPPLSKVQYVVGGIPMILLFAGGALGGVTGALATVASYSIFRGNGSHTSKFLKVTGVILAAFVVYLVMATIVSLLVNR